MTLVIPPGFAQAAFRYSLTGDPEVMVTTIGISVDGPGNDEAFALRDAHALELTSGTISSGWSFLGVHLRVGQDGGPPVTVEANGVTTGVGSAQTLPNNCGYLLRKLTGLGGRVGRGRMFIPPFYVSEGSINAAGVLDEGARGALEANWENILAPGPPIFLLHDSTSPTTTPTPITALVMDAKIATQRRRLRR